MSMTDQVKTTEPFVGPVDQPSEPMDVKIVGTVRTADVEQRRFRTGASGMQDAQVVQVLGADRKRRDGAVINNSTQLVYLLDDRSSTVSMGYPLLPNGGGLGISHQAAVYAVCPTATAADPVVINYALEIAL